MFDAILSPFSALASLRRAVRSPNDLLPRRPVVVLLPGQSVTQAGPYLAKHCFEGARFR